MHKKYFNFITDEVEIRWPDLLKPRVFSEKEQPKYGCAILIKKDSTNLALFMENIANEAKQYKLPLKSISTLKSIDSYRVGAELKLSKKLDQGKLDQETYEDYAQRLISFCAKYKDYYITKARTKKKPVLVDRYGKDITDIDGIHGAIVRLNLCPSYYEGFGEGITLYLNGVQVIKLGQNGNSEAGVKEAFGVYKGPIKDESLDKLEHKAISKPAKFEVEEEDAELPF